MDEAHLIPGKPTFEEIRLLTNFQLDDRNLIAIVLIGQPELRERLQHRAYRALTQRIGAQFHLTPLSADDSAVVRAPSREAWREESASCSRAAPSGVLHRASGGLPRVLNHLATQALLEGLAEGAAPVDEEIATAAAEGQFLPPFTESRRAALGRATSMGRMAEARKRARKKPADEAAPIPEAPTAADGSEIVEGAGAAQRLGRSMRRRGRGGRRRRR